MAANTISLSISSNFAASKGIHSLEPPHLISPRTVCFHLGSSLSVRAGAKQLINEPANGNRSITSSTTVEVDLGNRSYPIYIGAGLLDQSELLQRHVHGKRVLVVTNERVAPLYLNKTVDSLTRGNPNVTVESVILPDGEKYKDMDTLMKIFDKAIESRLDRRCTFVALGGGVIGDMCGYAAASYLRGVNFIQIPTTVMAQVALPYRLEYQSVPIRFSTPKNWRNEVCK